MIKEPKDIKGDVKEIFTPFGELIAENLAEELEAKGGLLVPKESYVKNYTQKIVHAIEEGLEKRKNHLQRAAKILEIEHAALPKVEKERLEEEMKTILQKMASSVNQREEKKEKTISFLSKETLIWIYQIGSAYAAKGLQEDALAIFQMLTILHPDSSDFWVAQGIIEKTLHQESDALISFSMAIAANPKANTSVDTTGMTNAKTRAASADKKVISWQGILADTKKTQATLLAQGADNLVQAKKDMGTICKSGY